MACYICYRHFAIVAFIMFYDKIRAVKFVSGAARPDYGGMRNVMVVGSF